jgi:chemotaxis protein MotB
MKNIPSIVLSVLLAAFLISGIIVYRQDQAKLLSKDERITELQGQLKEAGAKLAALKEELAKIKGEKEASEVDVKELKSKHEAEISELDKELQSRNEKIAELQKQLKVSDAEIASLKEEVDKSQKELERLHRKLSEILGQEVELKSEKDQMRSTYDAMVSELKEQIQRKEVTIKKLKEKLSIVFVDRILFESGKAKITSKGKEILKRVGDILKNVEGKRIQVVGHTDNRPILPEYRYKIPSNWELSALRAAAVVRFIQKDSGIDAGNFEVVGHSLYKPVASNKTEAGRTRNRRVNIILSPKVE